MKITILFALLALSPAHVSCSAPSAPPEFSAVAIENPTSGPATSPRVSGGKDSQLIMSWLQPDGDITALQYSQYNEGRWSDAQTVVEIVGMFVNWADLPSVVSFGDGHLAAHWLQRAGEQWYAYDVMFTQSFDDGATWSLPMRPHTDGTPSEHGFVSMYSTDGSVGLVWLDGRKMINEVTDDPVASGMTLRAAVIDGERALHAEQSVDDLICDCCQTDIAIAASGPVAVYRDRSVDETRDIYVTRHVNGRWQTGNPVASDKWEIAGCPVNGPSIVAQGSKVIVAWFSAAQEPVVRVAISEDNGAHFDQPIDVIRSNTLGRVAVAMLEDGDVAVSWLQSSDSGNRVNVRRIVADGSPGPIRVISSTAAAFSVPQMVRSGNDLVFAWTESGDDGAHVASARVDYRSL